MSEGLIYAILLLLFLSKVFSLHTEGTDIVHPVKPEHQPKLLVCVCFLAGFLVVCIVVRFAVICYC